MQDKGDLVQSDTRADLQEQEGETWLHVILGIPYRALSILPYLFLARGFKLISS